jgi:hypothetical protein
MSPPNKGALLDWASYLALLLLVIEVLYKKLTALVVQIAIDVQRIPHQILRPVAWFSLGILVALSVGQLLSKRKP